MKKILITLALLAGVIAAAFAAPALPGKIKYTQPDGSVIVLENHGDEYYHWKTNDAGQIVEKDADGFYRPIKESPEAYRARKAKPRPVNRALWSSFDNPPVTNFGDRKILCILANFTDSVFTVDNPHAHFDAMLNQEGYSAYGAVGSVRDYFIDNSLGQYRPEFDVYGPVTLSGSSKYYDDNGADKAIHEAYELMKGEIPIDDYDTDGDGVIDMILFYYPGHNQAEGAGEESIWPHRSRGDFGTLGGKIFNGYFCTSEYRGASGQDPCGIGTTCHEFSHSLGLPDFYDSDYATNGSNDFTTGDFDLMCSGNYNESGRRPPYYNAMERHMVGWMPAPVEITDSDSYTLEGIQENVAYQRQAKMPGEYFIFECRNGEKWDQGVQSGLLVYHVDKTNRLVGGGRTAARLWEETNMINAYGGHPCFRLYSPVKAPKNWNDFVFPGENALTGFTPLDWDGTKTEISLSGITYQDGAVTFQALVEDKRTLTGCVTDIFGSPLENVQMVLSKAAYPYADAAPSLLQEDLVAYTNAAGYYEFSFGMDEATDRILSASLAGYVPACVNLTLTEHYQVEDLVLLALGETPAGEMKNFEDSWATNSVRFNNSYELHLFGSSFSSEYLLEKDLVGSRIRRVSFLANAKTYSKIYIVVDFDDQRVLVRDVTELYAPSQWVVVDVTDANLIIPEGKKVVLGWGLEGRSTTEFHAITYKGGEENEGFLFGHNLNGSSWSQITSNPPRHIAIVASVTKDIEVGLDAFGISYITMDEGMPKLIPAAGKTFRSVTWTLDGAPVEAPVAPDQSSSGTHLYEAVITYFDGTTENVFYQFTNK